MVFGYGRDRKTKISRRAVLKGLGALASSALLGSGSSDNKPRTEPFSSVADIYEPPRVLESQEVVSLEESSPLYYRIEEFKAKWKVVPPFLDDLYQILSLYFNGSVSRSVRS
ncbi:MAG: hypothetical protein KatS3mg093_458 [Candidatus Parcubacteria bacterium]|nr:MAG: hypothetical protein KatS3mg093_458 [Candidatus Parcubacteria bacterium]